MSRSEGVLYPPGEILNPIMGKTDFEYVILWMLSNNSICEWSDFTAEISESTLSGNLKKLMNKGYIEKPEKGKYQITSQGRDRFSELVYDRKSGERRLRYPPEIITKIRNYDHWILWMLYNNYSCKWSDFKQEPLSINQSSLSNNLNSLIDDGFVARENKEYIITPLGKTEYLRILKSYDLDRQSILEQESKRIEDITEKTRRFFRKYIIEDDELKFRYLDYVLKLSYSKVDAMLKDEEDFNKILLFLSINHPNQYPKFISPEEFSSNYNTDITTLNYYIREIIDNQFFQVKFFKIEDEQQEGVYYFQKNEPIEKILNALVEKHITKFTYLNKFKASPSFEIELLLEKILNDICGNLFNENLKPSIRTFLPEYIKYLAYKIETETKLVDRETKLEGFVWQNIFEEFQTFEPSRIPKGMSGEEEYYYAINKCIFNVLDIGYLTKLNFLWANEIKETYDFNKVEGFNEISKALYKYKPNKAKELYISISKELDEVSNLVLQDLLYTAEIKFDESLDITKKIIEKFPKDYIGYLLQSLTYFKMDNFEKALEVIDIGLKETPHILLTCQKAQILVKNNESGKASQLIEEGLQTHPHCISLLRVKIIDYIFYWAPLFRKSGEILNLLNSIIKMSPKDKELVILKGIFYCIINDYKEAKRFLVKEIEFNYFKKNPRIDTTSLFILTFAYVARGKFDKALQITKQILDLYSNHPISYVSKALVLGYNLIYKFKFQEPNVDTINELIEIAISLEPNKSNMARYLELKGYILQGIKQHEEALDAINRAIEIIPNLYILYPIKVQFLMIMKRSLNAIELIDETLEKYPHLKRILKMHKSFVYFNSKHYDDALNIVDDLIESYPDNIEIVNNKVIFLGYLGRKEEAIETAEYLISLDSNNGNSYDTYGEALMVLGEYESALEKLVEALKIQPSGWFAQQTCLKMGKCYQALGLYEEALDFYEKAKILAEHMHPGESELYEHDTEKYLMEIRALMEKSKSNEKTR